MNTDIDFELVDKNGAYALRHKELGVSYQTYDVLKGMALNEICKGHDPQKPLPSGILTAEKLAQKVKEIHANLCN